MEEHDGISIFFSLDVSQCQFRHENDLVFTMITAGSIKDSLKLIGQKYTLKKTVTHTNNWDLSRIRNYM